MKAIIISLFALLSFSAMANDVRGAISDVEFENNARCTEVSTSFRKCLNTACLYSVEYFCSSNDKDFTAKVKVIEYQNFSGEKVVKSRGVKITR